MKFSKLLRQILFLKKNYITGDIYVNYVSNKKTLENLTKVSSIAIISIFIFLLFYIRSFTNVLIITIPAFLCFSISFFLISVLSDKVTIISIIIPCNMFIITLSDSIHILFRSFLIDKNNKSWFQLFKSYVRHLSFPCFVTSLTTAVGFLAFCFSDITYLRDFSYVAAPIVMLGFLVTILITSFLIAINPKTLQVKCKTSSFFCTKFFKYKNTILLITALLFLNSFALTQLKIEGNFISMFFKEQSKTRQELKFFDKNFSGSMSLNVVIKTNKQDFFKKIKNYQKIINLQNKVNSYPEVAKTLSYKEQIQLIHRELKPTTNNPENDIELEQELFFLNLSRSDKDASSLAPYMNFNFANTRLHFITKQLSITANNQLIKKIEEDLKQFFPNEESFVSGSIKTNNTISKYILDTQFKSIGIATGVIFLIFIIYFGVRVSLIAIIPNVLPLISVLSIIAYFNIPLDISIVLLVAISFSFCVDNSSHFIHFYNKLDEDVNSNLLTTLNVLVHPFTVATVILTLGLFSFVFADLLILEKFGLFSSLTIVISLFFNILFLPMLIKQFTKK